MNYIYTNTRNNRQYVLDPQTTMGEKVCLVDMAITPLRKKQRPLL